MSAAGDQLSIRAKKTTLWTMIMIIVLILLCSGAIFAYQNAYANKIYRNVFVAGIDLSGKTKKQAEVLLTKKFNTILAKDVSFIAGGKQITAALSDTGLSFDIKDGINKAYAIGRGQHFIPSVYASAQTNFIPNKISVPVLIDNTKLNLFISEKIPELSVAPQDASLSISNSEVVISPESNGQNVNTSNLAADLTNLITSGADKYEIKLQAISTMAGITTSDLNSIKSQAEDIINSKITLIYTDKTYTPSTSDISAWIAINSENGRIVLSMDNTAIKSYLARVAKNFEIIKKDHKINANDNSVIEEGVQGLYLDKDQALTSIKNAIETKNSNAITLVTYTQDPTEVKVYPDEGIVPDKFDGKYIDVDLTQQRLCRVENHQVIDCFIVSTGKASMPTPTGTRYVLSKNPRQWSAKYSLWMPWWQSLGGGYGIHELPEWPNGYKEGENHLGTPVSHGCIRLGVGPAQTVFDWTEIGTPIYIHK